VVVRQAWRPENRAGEDWTEAVTVLGAGPFNKRGITVVRKWFFTVAVACCALSIPFSAIAQSLTVDVCEGGDLHRSNPAHLTNTLSVTRGGTYPVDPTDYRFGCHRDTPETLLGSAAVTTAKSPGSGTVVDHVHFHLTAEPNIGDIVVEGNGVVLAGNGGCPTPTDLTILYGSGAFAGMKGVAHVTGVNPTVCQVTFAPQ
jgi:hypothetical protein